MACHLQKRPRHFLPKEEESADVAMVTENFWQKQMGGDARVIGRSVTLDGSPHTIVGTDYLRAQLYQVSAHNPALLGGAAVLLTAIALMACPLPARRAARVDPAEALRSE